MYTPYPFFDAARSVETNDAPGVKSGEIDEFEDFSKGLDESDCFFGLTEEKYAISF